METMKLAEKKKMINDFIETKQDGQFSTGLFFRSVGNKFVHYYSTWDQTTEEKMDIDDFIENYVH
jgi:hypothetical protein